MKKKSLAITAAVALSGTVGGYIAGQQRVGAAPDEVVPVKFRASSMVVHAVDLRPIADAGVMMKVWASAGIEDGGRHDLGSVACDTDARSLLRTAFTSETARACAAAEPGVNPTALSVHAIDFRRGLGRDGGSTATALVYGNYLTDAGVKFLPGAQCGLYDGEALAILGVSALDNEARACVMRAMGFR